jgi:subtilisin family serine protease
MRQVILGLFFLLSVFSGYSQENTLYRLLLTDKGNSPYNLNNPEEFLSSKSIERRTKQGFSVDTTDLPIDPTYFSTLIDAGATIYTYSKWVNTIVIGVSEEALAAINNLPFVSQLYPVWRGSLPKTVITKEEKENIPIETSNLNLSDYGDGLTQISLSNGHLLHELGYKGAGMTIAVLDAGFKGANVIDYFNQSKILGVKNFTHENGDPLQGTMEHGTKVLSCMLANKQGDMIGTAPQANYYLFKTEMNDGEYPVEEDYWIAGLEYADSLGVDIVTSSLGYNLFNDPSMDHDLSQLDGKTVPSSRAASMAARKGILLLNSAGNEANMPWKKIMVSADAENILTVGSVTYDSIRSSFSSLGNTSDGRIKPDVMAMGSNVTVIGANGKGTSGGTSFACPITAGLSACLWEALPNFNSLEIAALIRESAHLYQTPDSIYGYGIPDFFKAYTEGSTKVSISNPDISSISLKVDTNENRIYISKEEWDLPVRVSVYTTAGFKIFEEYNHSGIIDISRLEKGVYITCLQSGNKKQVQKFIKPF